MLPSGPYKMSKSRFKVIADYRAAAYNMKALLLLFKALRIPSSVHPLFAHAWQYRAAPDLTSGSTTTYFCSALRFPTYRISSYSFLP